MQLDIWTQNIQHFLWPLQGPKTSTVFGGLKALTVFGRAQNIHSFWLPLEFGMNPLRPHQTPKEPFCMAYVAIMVGKVVICGCLLLRNLDMDYKIS